MMAVVINKDLEKNKNMLIPLLVVLLQCDAKKHDNKEQLKMHDQGMNDLGDSNTVAVTMVNYSSAFIVSNDLPQNHQVSQHL